MRSHLVGLPAPAPAEPVKWKALQVGRTLYRMVPSETSPNGFAWWTQCGVNAMGEPEWRSVQMPQTAQVLAALYELAG